MAAMTLPGVAHADIYVGSGTLYVGPVISATVKSNGYATWNKNTRVVTIKATGYNMTSGNCETTWFDWEVSNGHFDARAVRQCDLSSSLHQGTSTESVPGGFSFVAMQKFAACYGANNTTSGCADSSQAQIPLGSVNPSLNTSNWITRYWLMKANGTTEYHDGGNSRLADS